MEKGTRVQEIRRRFEGLNSLNKDSCIINTKQVSSDISIKPQPAKKYIETEPQNIKGGIKRSHAFRSDKAKVKSLNNTTQFFDTSGILPYCSEISHTSSNSSPVIGKPLNSYNSISSNILKSPNTSPLKPLPREITGKNRSPKVEILTDTLKKALKTPLPSGPPPKKPPRTFAHGRRSEDNHKERILCQTSSFETPNSDGKNVLHKNSIALSRRSKTDPHIMLKKLESALLINEVSKTDSRQEVSCKSLVKKNSLSPISNKISGIGAKTLHLSGLSSCINKNIYDTPFEYKSKGNFGEFDAREVKNVSLRSTSCKPKKEQIFPHIYEEPYSPLNERKIVVSATNRFVKTSSSKPSVHYMSSPVQENKKITVSADVNENNKIKMITDTFNDNTRSDSDADSVHDEKNGNQDEVTAVRKVYAQRVSSMRRQTPYVIKRDNLFEALLLIGIDQDMNLGKIPYIKTKFPDTAEVVEHLPCLVFPDATDWPPSESRCQFRKHTNYTLILTRDDGLRKYAYCRRLQPEGAPFCLPLAYVLITPHKDNVFYYAVLAELEMRHGVPQSDFLQFVQSLFLLYFPKPGYHIRIGESVINRAADPRKDSYDISTVLQGATVPVFIKIFSSLLIERKIIIIGPNISVVSDCIEGLQKALFPFEWELPLVGAVPSTMMELCEVPGPTLMGVIRPKQNPQNSSFLPLKEIGDCLMVDIESGEILVSCGDEHTLLPSRLTSCLRTALYLCQVHGCDVAPSEALIRLFVELIGHYNKHVVTNVHTNTRTFQRENFIKEPKSRSVQSFLEWFTETAMFQCFIQRRLDRSFEPGLFEQRCAEYIKESVRNNNVSKKEKSLNKTVKIIGDRFKDWTSSS